MYTICLRREISSKVRRDFKLFIRPIKITKKENPTYFESYEREVSVEVKCNFKPESESGVDSNDA